MSSIEKLNQRISLLEADTEIKELKYRYWNACDSKNPKAILKCFDANDVVIDYEDFGVFSSALNMVNKYKENSCHPHLIEQHAGKNPIINFMSSDQAKGTWSMAYTLVDTKKKISLNLTGIYKDLYIRTEGGSWLIKKSNFKKTATYFRGRTENSYLRAKVNRSLGFKKTV